MAQASQQYRLDRALDLYRSVVLDAYGRQRAASGIDNNVEAGVEDLVDKQIAAVRPEMGAFLRDNKALTARQLEDLAAALSPGGKHNGGLLGRLVAELCPDADAILLAAIKRHNWHGGKVGFQYLPDPRTTPFWEYDLEAEDLLDSIRCATRDNPRGLLTGDDLAFFESLPSSLFIYRGCSDVPAETAGAGVCWSTRRDIASWFAGRFGNAPILVRAKIRKDDIVLAKASEFEIVARPVQWISLNPGPASQPRIMAWHP
jgi:hypothetical protein